jgi:hypothetical protein
MKLLRDMSSEESRKFWSSLEVRVVAAMKEMPSWFKGELEEWYSAKEAPPASSSASPDSPSAATGPRTSPGHARLND